MTCIEQCLCGMQPIETVLHALMFCRGQNTEAFSANCCRLQLCPSRSTASQHRPLQTPAFLRGRIAQPSALISSQARMASCRVHPCPGPPQSQSQQGSLLHKCTQEGPELQAANLPGPPARSPQAGQGQHGARRPTSVSAAKQRAWCQWCYSSSTARAAGCSPSWPSCVASPVRVTGGSRGKCKSAIATSAGQSCA